VEKSKKLPWQPADLVKVTEPMVIMGRIVGPHGVKGHLKVLPYTEDPDGLLEYSDWWLGGRGEGDSADNDAWYKASVTGHGITPHGLLIVAVECCADRDAAAALKGTRIGILRHHLPELADNGEEGYYWSDLTGMEVINQQGEYLGIVTGLVETGANDVLVTHCGAEKKRERLIPFIEQVILKVERQACRIVVDWNIDD
jgi:16S rRNA processing protein RimM